MAEISNAAILESMVDRVLDIMQSRGLLADDADARAVIEALRDSDTIETFDTINQWQRKTFPTATLQGVLGHIKEEWKEFQIASSVSEQIEEVTDLIILLACFIDKAWGAHDSGAQQHVDAKMSRNRARQWNIQQDGTGRHIKLADRPEHDWRAPEPGEALEEGGFCRRCGRPASEADQPCEQTI